MIVIFNSLKKDLKYVIIYYIDAQKGKIIVGGRFCKFIQ